MGTTSHSMVFRGIGVGDSVCWMGILNKENGEVFKVSINIMNVSNLILKTSFKY